MELKNLASAIVRSLKDREMDASFAEVLMNDKRNRVLRRDETEYWDYKERVDFDDPFGVARFAKRVLGFHNAKGGALIYGVDNEYKVPGVSPAVALDSNKLNQKLRKYVGATFLVFQDSIELQNGKVVWVIFVPRREGPPVPVQENGPTDDRGRPEIKKNEYYLRVNDETKACSEPAEFERLFSGISLAGQQAYLYDVDEPYFRLLAHHCDLFVGRRKLLNEVKAMLVTRHPIIALDGVGGVGKSALAIELLRNLYDTNEYLFIVSISAKSKVWTGYASSRVAGFSGMTEFISEIAKVLQIPTDEDLGSLKEAVIQFMRGCKGLLLVDNIEDIDDPAILNFLSVEVPEPVKVLVTSRIDRALGALTKSIPEMDRAEAHDLLQHELKRLGYCVNAEEAAYEDEIVEATGRLPLAIKWGASLAVTSRSLAEASRKLRSMDPKKKEFLNFCFKTMFDELSPLAKEVATLSPYLAHEWNIPTLTVALGRAETEIEAAVAELRDRGIVLATTERASQPMRLLPMTIDFLSTKLHENHILTSRVEARLADAMGSAQGEGVLLNWPYAKRIDVVMRRIVELRDQHDYTAALQLIRLARSWSERQSRTSLDFLEGQMDYLKGDRAAGLALMRSALDSGDPDGVPDEQRIFFADALLSHGTKRDELLVVEVLEDVIPRTDDFSPPLLKKVCELAFCHEQNDSLRRICEKTSSPRVCHQLADILLPRFDVDPQLPFKIGTKLPDLLRNAARASDASADARQHLIRTADALAAKFSSAS